MMLKPKTLAAISLSLVLFTGCQPVTKVDALGSHEQMRASKPIRIGSYFWPGSFWMDVAWDKGWFKDSGLDVERVDTNADYFKSFDDLVDGRLDLIGFTVFDLIRYDANGNDLIAIIDTDNSYGADAMVVQPGIHTSSDLVGKKIGVARGTYLDFLLSIYAKREGLDLKKVKLVDIKTEEADQELAKGKLSAVVTWEPVASHAVGLTKGRRLFSTKDVPGVCGAVAALRREFILTRPEDTQRIVDVWNRATEFLLNHPEESYAIVARVNKRPLAEVRDLAAADKILDSQDNKLAFSYSSSGFDSLHAVWRLMNDFMLEKGIVTKRAESTKFLDNRFLKGLK